jgi:hypothetical protein
MDKLFFRPHLPTDIISTPTWLRENSSFLREIQHSYWTILVLWWVTISNLYKWSSIQWNQVHGFILHSVPNVGPQIISLQKKIKICWVSMFRQWSSTIITDLQINIMASQIFLSLLSSIIIWYQKKWNFKLTSLTEKPAQNLYTTMSLIVHRDLHQFTMELLGLSLNQITSTGLVVFKVAAF